jgi:ribonuclease D
MTEEQRDGTQPDDSKIQLTRDEINKLPLRRYDGVVHIVHSDDDLARVIPDFKRVRVLGFDTETRPVFQKGKSYPPALVQLATDKAVYLFQLRHLTFPNALIDILENPKIKKAGVALDYDIKELQKLVSFEPAGMIELSTLASECGIGNNGLRGLAACLLGFRISKRAKTSNWGRSRLTESQIQYAATDAWVSREIYLALKKVNV